MQGRMVGFVHMRDKWREYPEKCMIVHEVHAVAFVPRAVGEWHSTVQRLRVLCNVTYRQLSSFCQADCQWTTVGPSRWSCFAVCRGSRQRLARDWQSVLQRISSDDDKMAVETVR